MPEEFDWTDEWKRVMELRRLRLQRGAKTQTTLFTVPAPPRPRSWEIVWRWNPARRTDGMTEADTSDFLQWMGDNPWQRHRRFYNITDKDVALEGLFTLRVEHPGKEFRLEVHRWDAVAEPTILD